MTKVGLPTTPRESCSYYALCIVFTVLVLEEQKKLGKLLPPGTYTTFYYSFYFVRSTFGTTRTTSVNLHERHR